MRILERAAHSASGKAAPAGRASTKLRGALSAALLIGVAQHAALANDTGAQNRTQDEPRKGNPATAVEAAEAAVVQAPQDAVLRVALGHAYLRAGRFESAVAALNGALALGGSADRIDLLLALAQIACGDNRAALATLDHAGSIAPADLGLALALAGDPGRGIAVLTDAVHAGPASPNLRQNLAYVYALDGRWADASLTAGFDLPPDQVNASLQQWAQSMQSGGERLRVVRLLNVPMVVDSGMPTALALDAPATNPASQSAAAPAPAPAPAQAPAVAAAELPPAPAVAEAAPVSALIIAVAPALEFVSVPIVQVLVTAPKPALARDLAIRAQGANPDADHFVQLAAYHNQRDAERGKLILAKRLSLLRGHGLLVNQTMIHGRSYWRVVLAGFDGAAASNMCSSLKRHGAACFAYSVKGRREGPAMALANAPIADSHR